MPLADAMLKRRLNLATRGIYRANMGSNLGASLLCEQTISHGLPDSELKKGGQEIENFLKGEGVTQATTLMNFRDADIVVANPLLFEDIDEYSLHYGAVPFEVRFFAIFNYLTKSQGYFHTYSFTEANYRYSKKMFPFIAAPYTQFVDDSEFSKNFFLANCTQQLCMWIQHASIMAQSSTFNVFFKVGDALAFCDEMAQVISIPLNITNVESGSTWRSTDEV